MNNDEIPKNPDSDAQTDAPADAKEKELSDNRSRTIKCEKVKKKKNYWPLKITVITFILALVFSLVSNVTSSRSNLTIAIMLLVFLILLSILFDGVGVSVTSCDLSPLNAMAAKKVPHAKMAIWLVKNAEKVNNICADVIGDICGIVSGACGVAIVAKLVESAQNASEFWITIILSSLIAAATVGGKAFMKAIAIKNSREFVMFTAKVLSVFTFKKKKAKK